jgi:hypothetical protein
MIVCCFKNNPGPSGILLFKEYLSFRTISFFVLIVQAMARFGEMAYAEFSVQLVGWDPESFDDTKLWRVFTARKPNKAVYHDR